MLRDADFPLVAIPFMVIMMAGMGVMMWSMSPDGVLIDSSSCRSEANQTGGSPVSPSPKCR